MNFRTFTARTAVAGVTTALAAGALVGVSTGTATAATASSTYACTALGGPVGDFAMSVDTPVVPAEGTAGQSFPGDLLGLTSVITIPAGAAALLESQNVDGGRIDDYAAHIGSTSINAPLTFEAPVAQNDGTAKMTGAGANEPFSLPGAGTYGINLPEAFTFTPTSEGEDLAVTVSCTTADPASLGEIKLTKDDSTVAAKSAKAGKKYKVTTTAKRVNDPATVAGGKVVVKVGKKSWTKALDKKGKAVFTLPASAKNKKATVTYKGDKFTAPSKTSVKVK